MSTTLDPVAEGGPPRTPPLTERQFATTVDALAADPAGAQALVALLAEDHAVYDQRGTTATIRMRGWVLLALGRLGVPDLALLHVLEELDNGRDAYLVAAAAQALRARPRPEALFAPFLGRALANIRFHDDALSLDRYGGYGVDAGTTTAFREVLATVAWLAEEGRALAPQLAQLALSAPHELTPADLETLNRIRAVQRERPAPAVDCCDQPLSLDLLRLLKALRRWDRGQRTTQRALARVTFEDQDGRAVAWNSFFIGCPTIVVFFYTRCENPQKCSLTIAKLGRLVRELGARGLGQQVRTAAITYDPAWDVPERLSGYARSRSTPVDDDHRLLRATEGMDTVRAHFGLGVNFIESLVNRHRIELFVLDAEGRIAARFQRLQWNEQQVADEAAGLLNGNPQGVPDLPARLDTRPAPRAAGLARTVSRSMSGTVLAVVTAFFPKCAACWTAYLSVLGVAELARLPYYSWLLPVFAGLLLVNLLSVWRRTRGNRLPFWISAAGVFAILVGGVGLDQPAVSQVGLALTVAGSLLSVFRLAQAAKPSAP